MITSRSAGETFEFGRSIASGLKRGDVLALKGDLGAGKTHFVKGVARGLGIEVEVTSPTFTLIHEYSGGGLPLYHIDLYRLDSAEEALRIGLDEYLRSDGVTAIEWADKFSELIPPNANWFEFRLAENDTRLIERRP
jgi:tRNA threonylcarbamoyladenosine biosynthesis protein TsaE